MQPANSQIAQSPDEPQTHPSFTELYQQLLQSDLANFRSALNAFIKSLIDTSSPDHSLRFDLFVENHLLRYLLQTLRSQQYHPEYFSAIFHNIQVLIQNITLPSQKLYLVTYLHKEGYFEEKYPFNNEEEVSYFILILRSLTRKMLLEEKQYINIFVNVKQPHFPIVYNTMKFYNHPQSHVVTASRYILLQLANANFSYLKQTFFVNFPFVTYFAQLAFQIRSHITKSIKQNSYEKILLILMFFEEFVGIDDKQSINMYANCFFSVVVRRIMKLLIKEKDNLVSILQLIQALVSRIKVEKILEGLRKLLFSEIESDFLRFVQSKQLELSSYSQTYKSSTYLDNYLQYIKQHCIALYNKKYQKRTHSYLSKMWMSSASYLVHNQKGLQGELDRLGQVLGVNIPLNSPINHDNLLSFSYVGIFQKQQIMSNNPYFKIIMVQSSKKQIAYFHLIKILIQLKIMYSHLLTHLTWHLNILTHCRSISSPKLIYKQLFSNYKQIPQVDKKLQVILIQYQRNLIGKIITYLLQHGWEDLKSHGLYLSEQAEGYQSFIFRDIQCEIVLLMIVNLLLKNQPIALEGQVFKKQSGRKTKILEKIVSSLDPDFYQKVFLRFNCQDLQILNEEDELVNSIKVSQYKIYQDPSCTCIIEFISQKSRSFSLYFNNQKLSQYVYDSLLKLRSKVKELEQELQNLYFDVV